MVRISKHEMHQFRESAKGNLKSISHNIRKGLEPTINREIRRVKKANKHNVTKGLYIKSVHHMTDF